jgi:hypothetical protein
VHRTPSTLKYKRPLIRFLAIAGPLLVFLNLVSVARSQPASKEYRGSVGDKHVEMKLISDGVKIKGTYMYDQFRQAIQLEGAFTSPTRLELLEGAGKKKTGKFVCQKHSNTYDVDLECEWSRIDGTSKAFVALREQFRSPAGKLTIVPKVITERKPRTSISLPQIEGSALSPAIAAFNLMIQAHVQQAKKEFFPDAPESGVYDLNYLVMWSNDDIISIELEEYSDSGGAHPNTRLMTVNYSLVSNRQLTLGDVFKQGANYESVIAAYVTKDINMRADQMDQDEAQRNNRPVEKRDEPVMVEDRLPGIDAWSLRPDGLAVYFDFPHVMAVFDRTVIPYSVIRDFLKPDGVVAQIAKP